MPTAISSGVLRAGRGESGCPGAVLLTEQSSPPLGLPRRADGAPWGGLALGVGRGLGGAADRAAGSIRVRRGVPRIGDGGESEHRDYRGESPRETSTAPRTSRP